MNIEEETILKSMELLVRLAKKGKRHDEIVKNMIDKFEKKELNLKEKLKDIKSRYRKAYQENVELKSTHQDWVAKMCSDCGGAGGFDDGHGGGEPCHCDCGTIYIKKEGEEK